MSEKPEALRLADWMQNAVQTYPQMSEDEPGGYYTEADQVMDEAAAELRRLHALCDEMGQTVEMLLWLINRDAPQLSGKTIGYAEASLAKWKESR